MDRYGLMLRVSKSDSVRVDSIVAVNADDEKEKLYSIFVGVGNPRNRPDEWVSVYADQQEEAYNHWRAYVAAVEAIDPAIHYLTQQPTTPEGRELRDSYMAAEHGG